MKKNKKSLIFLIAGIAYIFSGCGAETTQQTTEITENTTENITENVSEQSKSEISSSAPLTLSEELYKKIEKINNACLRYYKNTKNEKKFYSWAGILSSLEQGSDTQEEITVQTLKNLGYITDEDFVADAFNVYMKPIDIDESYKKTSLDIFTVLETTEGYALYGEGYGRKILPKETFRNIVLKYNPDNGDVTNPPSNSELYNNIIIAISHFRKDFPPENSSVPNYIVRYMACNDLYAIVILSGADDVTDTTEYLLKKENNSWNVIKNALENESDVRTALNQQYPDFYLGILPPYTLYEYRKQVRTTEHYQEILNMLKQQNIIDKNDTVTYCCGTQNVLYFEFKSGKKLAGGAKKDGTFSCNLVNTYEDAIKELGRFVNPVPAFILKYNN